MSEKPHILDSHVAYDGRIFQAVVERVRLPGRDRDSQVEIVRHAGSVAIAAMPTEDSVLLVRQYRHPAGASCGSCPREASTRGRMPRRPRGVSATRSWE